jgi:endonuclease/exonuclease/phosphatase family metal-dependent hydrolase
MASSIAPISKKRKREDVVVFSANVQGMDPDDLARAIKKIRPDIIALQEAPKANHALYKTLNKALDDVNADSMTKTECQYAKPQIVPEFPPGTLSLTPTLQVYPDQTVKKSYCLIHNTQKLNQIKAPALVNYGKDKKRQKEIRKCKDATAATDAGFGARPPVHAEFETTSDKKRVGFFTWHAPTEVDPYHDTAMDFFEESELVEHSKTSNHMTVVCGDMNNLLQNHFTDFHEGTGHKFDHVIAHNAASGNDLLNDYPTELNAARTKTQDHFSMANGFNFK